MHILDYSSLITQFLVCYVECFTLENFYDYCIEKTLLLTSCCPFSLRFIIKSAVDIFIEIGRVFTFVKISSLLFFSCPVCPFIFNLQIRYQVMPYSAQYKCTLEGSCFSFKYFCDTSYAKCCLIYLSPYSLIEMTLLYVIIALGI